MLPDINNVTIKFIIEILEDFYIFTFVKFLLQPFINLRYAINCMVKQRHPIKSLTKSIFIVIFSILSYHYFFNDLAVHTFFTNISTLFVVNKFMQQIIAINLSLIFFARIGDYLGNIVTRVFCRILFGDADFYIPDKDLHRLLEKLHLQGYTKINKNHIIEIIEFCKRNSNELSSKEIGAKSIDWRQSFKSLKYDASIEHFLDQQLALRNKKLEICIKKRLIDHCDINEEDLGTMKIIYKGVNCHFYMTQDPQEYSIDELFNTLEKEFERFKDNFLKYHTSCKCVSGQQLFHQFKCYLNHKELNTSIGIYPNISMENILYNSFCDSYCVLYNSKENSINNSVEHTPHQTSLDSENSVIISAQEIQVSSDYGTINPISIQAKLKPS